MGRLFALVSGLTLLLSASASYALGFGEIQLQSSLNQPLKAEIPLLAVKPAERDQVSVEVASPDTFKRFGITRPGILDQIDVHVESGSDNSRLRVLVTSRVPIKEPFLTFLVEANWPAGRAIREYTVLLDPPVGLAKSSAQTQPPPRQAAVARKPLARPRPAKPKPAPLAPPRTAPAAAPIVTAPTRTPAQAPAAQPRSRPAVTASQAAPSKSYGPVAPEETLWSIAKEMRPAADIGMNQMMLAIYQTNTADFDGNINLIRKGSVLIIPPAGDIRAIDKRAAKAEIADQTRSYRASKRAPTRIAKKQAKPQPAAAPAKTKLHLEAASDDASAADTNTKVADSSKKAATPSNDLDALGAASVESAQSATEADNQTESNPSQSEAAIGSAATSAKPAPSEPAEAASSSNTDNSDLVSAQDQPATDGSAPNTEQTSHSATGPSDQLGNQPGGISASQADNVVPGQGDNIVPAQGGNSVPGQTSQANTGSAQVTPSSSAQNSGADNLLPGAQAVTPVNQAGTLITPQRVLLLLAVLLLIVACWMVWDRRKYKPVPADFSWDTPLEKADDDEHSMTDTPVQPEPVLASVAVPDLSEDPQDVDELLADADSFIENDLYDEALDSLELGLETHPGNQALQRKILEVHHAAGERQKFMHKLDVFFPNPPPQDANWLAVAAMAQEFAPDDARFESPIEAQTEEVTSAFPQDQIEPSTVTTYGEPTQQPAEVETGAVAQGSFSPDGQQDTFGETLDITPATTPDVEHIHTTFEESPDASDWAPVGAAKDIPEAASEPAEISDDAAFDFDLTDFDTSFEDKPAAPSNSTAATPVDLGDDASEILEFDTNDLEFRTGGDNTLAEDPSLIEPKNEPAIAVHEPVSDIGTLGDDFDWSQDIDTDWADTPAVSDSSDFATAASPETAVRVDSGPDADAAAGANDDGFATTALTDVAATTGGAEDETPDIRTDDDLSALDDLEFNDGSKITDADALQLEQIEDAGLADISKDSISDGADFDDDDETVTKLDLARAYIDMGEAEMAASLLEDVQTQGNPEQQREAQSLLARIG